MNLAGPAQVAEVAATIGSLREDQATPYDIAVALPVDADPAPYGEPGATWWMYELDPEDLNVEMVRGMVREGPAG